MPCEVISSLDCITCSTCRLPASNTIRSVQQMKAIGLPAVTTQPGLGIFTGNDPSLMDQLETLSRLLYQDLLDLHCKERMKTPNTVIIGTHMTTVQIARPTAIDRRCA